MNLIRAIADRLKGKPSARRSPAWGDMRRDFLVAHPRCAVCGGVAHLEVHHMLPFHVAPEFELAPDNLITLCESKQHGLNCHLLIGHLGNYRRWNQDVAADAKTWFRKLAID